MNQTVLVVDDDLDYLNVMEAQLSRAGFRVQTCDNVTSAESWLSDHTPDLVIVDLMMDNHDDGVTLCHAIKRVHPNLPIIMVTAVTSATGIEFDAHGSGTASWIKADALLAKPVRFEQLQRELTRLLKASPAT